VRSSYSQWEAPLTEIQTQVQVIAKPVFYHWTILVPHREANRLWEWIWIGNWSCSTIFHSYYSPIAILKLEGCFEALEPKFCEELTLTAKIRHDYCLNLRSNHQESSILASSYPTFFFQPSSTHDWTLAFLLAVHRLCGVIEGRLSHFLQRWLRKGWQSVISQGKIPWNTPPWLRIEPGPQGRQTMSYSTELSWLIALFIRSFFPKK